MLCAGSEDWPPMGLDDVVLNFEDGEVEGFGDSRPFETIAEWGEERRDDTTAWLSGLPDYFEEDVKGVA